jgi:hypothetical protein
LNWHEQGSAVAKGLALAQQALVAAMLRLRALRALLLLAV